MHDRLGPVRYRTPNLAPMSAFYRNVLGFTLRGGSESQLVLGSPSRDLLVLEATPSARRNEKTTGLYHTAFLVPSHRDLVHLLGRIATSQSPVEGFNHHGTHEAIYLPDPDGNGVELAWDLPQESWPMKADGSVDFLRHDLVFDPTVVLAEFEADTQPWEGIPDGSRVGHVHLHMANFAATKAFYSQILGLDIMMEFERNGMIFFAADGYHHHVGNNLWKGAGLPPAADDAMGLIEYSLLFEADRLEAIRERLRVSGIATQPREGGFSVKDPAGTGIALLAL